MADEEFKPADLAEIIDGAEPAIEPEAEPTQEAEQATPEDADEPVEATSEAEPDAKPEPVTEPTAEDKPEAGEPVVDEKPNDWTYHAYKDKNEKLQEARKRLEQVEAQNKALQYQQNLANQTPVETPDIFDDAEAYTKHVQEQANANVMPMIQGLQMQLSEQKHGAENMQKADDWFNTLPPEQQNAINQRYATTPDPYGGLISEFNRNTLLSEIGDDAGAYREKIKAEVQKEMLAAAQTAPLTPETPQANKFAPSLAGTKSTGARGGPAWKGPAPLHQIVSSD